MPRVETPYRIGIHAPRNAGKTCLFACLYGLRHLLSDQVAFDDEATLTYLRQVWEFIRKGQVPPATALTRPTEMTWRLRAGGDNWEIHSCDYPGALVEPSLDGATRELRAEAREWFRSCAAILILVDSAAPDVEQLDVVDLLLAELRKESADGKTVARPLALVLTKWDTQGPISADPEDEAERLQQYFVANKVFERLQVILKEAVRDPRKRFAVFPVSAFGMPGPGPGQAPPVEKLKPHNLLTPWTWAAEQAQQVGAARRRRARWRRRFVLGTVAVLLTTAAVSTISYANHRADRAFLELREFRQLNSTEPLAAARVARDEQFLTAWWSRAAPPQREVVRAWIGDDRAQMERYQAEQARIDRLRRHDTGWQRALDDEVRLGRTGDDAGIYAVFATFLEEFPETPHAERIHPRLAKARDAWDKSAWEELLKYEQMHGRAGNIQALIVRIRDYLKIPQANNRSDALKMLARYEEQWDREEYADLLKLAVRGSDGRNIEQLHARIVDYLNAPRNIKVMTPAVTHWQNWFAGLQQEGQYTVRVKAVSIPRRSQLDSFWGVDVRVTVELGDQSHRTSPVEGRNPTINADLGPYRFRWGDPRRLMVRVENHFELMSNDSAEVIIEDDRFVFGRCHGPVQITCRKGKTVTVHLECPAAVPPPLPPYGVK